MEVPIYEGEKPITSDNNLLGKFYLNGIKFARREKEVIDVTFKIDENGILHVEAKDRTNSVSNSITITNASCISPKEMDDMVSEADKRRKYDKEQRIKIMLKNQLKSYIDCVQNAIEDSSFKLSQVDKNQVSKICEDAWQWLASNRSASNENYEEKMIKVQEMCTSIMRKKENEKVTIKNQLNEYILSNKEMINDNGSYNLTEDKKSQLIEVCEVAEQWIHDNQLAEAEPWSSRLEETKRMCTMIIGKNEMERIASRNEVKSFSSSLKLSVEDRGENFTQEMKNQIIEFAGEIDEWLKNYRLYGKEMFREKLQKIKGEYNLILTGKRANDSEVVQQLMKKAKSNDEDQGGSYYFSNIQKEIKTEII